MQERPHKYSLVKAHTSDTFCFLNIWHSNGTSIHKSEGIDNYEEFYNDSKACFSVEVGYQGHFGGGNAVLMLH